MITLPVHVPVPNLIKKSRGRQVTYPERTFARKVEGYGPERGKIQVRQFGSILRQIGAEDLDRVTSLTPVTSLVKLTT